jgi:NADH-quinone oxidoreductase subunit M
MNEIAADFPILSVLVALPLLATGVAWTVKSARQAFALGVVAAALELALSLWLLSRFDPVSPDLQFVERLPILPFLSYHLGVDGLNILFVALTAFLTLMVILYGEIVHESPAGIYVASVFAFEATLMGLFLSVDLLEFWTVSLLELIPAGFALHRWGGASGKKRALTRYLQDMGGGLALLLSGVLILGWRHAEASGDWSFALTDLLATPLSAPRQSLPFVLFLYGLSVRMALFPFHAWLPIVAQHGPLATVCVFLVGLKVGIYALLRFIPPLLPEAAHEWKGFVVGLAVIGIFYGALLALMQINLRRLLAFSAVSQTGILVIGVFCLNREGLQGSLLSAINFGIAASALLFVTGVVYRSTRTTYLPRLGGLFDALPLLGLTFLLASLGAMAMPGTPGFDAAHLMLEGAIETHNWGVAAAMALGSVASAAFLLWAFQRAFLARRRDAALHPEKIRLSVPEAVLVAALCGVQLAVGFYTAPWLEIVDGSLATLARQVEGRAGGSR